jgi:hypothetical protein
MFGHLSNPFGCNLIRSLLRSTDLGWATEDSWIICSGVAPPSRAWGGGVQA